MNLLGSVGQLYMFVLLVLLFLGSGFALWRFINFLMERGANKQGQVVTTQTQNGTKNEKVVNNEVKKGKGGFIMANNGWVKLAVFSLVGIIVSVAILGFVSSSSNSMQGMNTGTMNQNTMQQQMGTNMQGSMNTNSQMGNMQAQGSMNMNGNMNQNQIIQQQLNQLQMQINQMQQQLGSMNGNNTMNGSMNGNSQMQQNSTGSMSGSGNMGGMGMGMMSGMMGMGNMQQSGNMNNMQQSSGSSSGGMGMM